MLPLSKHGHFLTLFKNIHPSEPHETFFRPMKIGEGKQEIVFGLPILLAVVTVQNTITVMPLIAFDADASGSFQNKAGCKIFVLFCPSID